METSRERSPSPELRCAVCRDSAAGAARCERCGTWVHDECRGPTGVCPTLGCGLRRAVEREQLDPGDWRPLSLIVLPFPLAATLVVAGLGEPAAMLVGVATSVVLWRACFREDRFGPP